MKHSLHVVFLIVFATSNAQNWNVFNTAYRYNYKHDTATVISDVLFQDSVKLNGSDTVCFLNRVVTECRGSCPGYSVVFTPTNAAILTNMPQFLQRQVNKYANGTVMLSDPFKLVILPNATVGQTWLFDSIANVTATCVATATQVIFNQTDSVRIIKVGGQDSLVLSKTFGIVKFPELYNKGRYYRLAGIEKRSSYDPLALFGQKVPNAWDFYNYQVGDVICESFVSNQYNGPSYECSKTQIGILSKTITATGYLYGAEVHGTATMTQAGPVYCNSPMQTSTTVLNYSSLTSTAMPENFIYPRMAFYSTPLPNLNGGSLPFGKIGYPNVALLVKGSDGLMYKTIGKYSCSSKQAVPNGPYMFLGSLTLSPASLQPYYGFPGSTVNYFTTLIMAEGLGVINSMVTHFEHMSEYCRTGFFRNGSLLFGSLYLGTEGPDNQEAVFSVFPNPAADYFQFKNPAAGLFAVTLANVCGAEVLNQTITGDGKIQIAQLPQGMYFLTVFQDNKVVTVQKIIKH